MTKILSFMNQKGGVAKTTSVRNVSACLAEAGKRVIAIDLDPQGSLTLSFGINPTKLEKHVYHLLRDENVKLADILVYQHDARIALAPTNLDLSGAEPEMLVDLLADRNAALRSKIAPYINRVDYILIDCPPSLGLLTLNALNAASHVVIPCQCQYLSYHGLQLLMNTVAKVRARMNPALKIAGIIPTMYDSRNKHDREILDALRRNYASMLIDIPVSRSTVIADSIVAAQAITEFDPSAPGSDSYKRIAEVLA